MSEQVAATVDLGVQALRDELRETVGLVRRVLAQTRARVLKGDTHYPDKLLSLFEPQTEAIRKGKATKPAEFGMLVKIQEAEAGLITDLRGLPDAGAGPSAGGPALSKHQELFGLKAPQARDDAPPLSHPTARPARRPQVTSRPLLQ